MKKIIALSLVLIFSVLLFSSCGNKQHTVEITVENYGVITLVLDESIAPITVKNFLKLVEEGFYDGCAGFVDFPLGRGGCVGLGGLGCV